MARRPRKRPGFPAVADDERRKLLGDGLGFGRFRQRLQGDGPHTGLRARTRDPFGGDLYWTGHADDRYFVFDSRSPHRIEVGASWVVSEKVPVTLSWYTVLFGAADVNHKGERAYASYFEAACPFTVKTVDMKAGVGMVPWNAAATYLTGDRGFCVQNVFLNAGKSWTIKGTDSMSVGVFTNLIWNPALDDVNFVGGISFRM